MTSERESHSLFDTKLGLRITQVSAQGAAGWAPVESNTQPAGWWHGGATATMIETLGSLAATAHADVGYRAVGTELSVSHLKGVRSGRVHGQATAVHLGGSSAVYQVELRDDEGDLIAAGRLSCRILSS